MPRARDLIENIHRTTVDPRVSEVHLAVEKALKKARIKYRVVGGLALNKYGAGRPTFDIDLVVSRSKWKDAIKALEPLAVDTDYTGLPDEPHGGALLKSHQGPWIEVFPDGTTAEQIALIRNKGYRKGIHGKIPLTLRGEPLAALINSKLASYLSSPDRLKDLADVQELVKQLKLTKDFASKLHPSVQKSFLKVLPKS